MMYDEMVEAARKKGRYISHAQSAFMYTSSLCVFAKSHRLCDLIYFVF